MADITVRSPFAELRRLLDDWRDEEPRVGRLFPAPFGLPDGALAVDVVESDGKYVVKASLPGFKRDEISVEVANGALTISAERGEEKEERDEHYVRRERYSGSAMRRVSLAGVTADSEVDAALKNGVLEVSVTAPGVQSAKKIEVREG